jgi:hypothetical protein
LFADREQGRELFEQWRDLPSREAWVKSGNFLFKRFAELGDHELALRVARHLVTSRSLSPQGLAVFLSMSEGPHKASRQPAQEEEEE